MEKKTFPFEIVISGMSGRLPESANLEEFRHNLFNGVDMVTEDDRRWKGEMFEMPHRMGKLKELDKFDAGFFGVHGKQTNTMDPRLRILLEVVHEAVLDAGVNPTSIRGSQTDVSYVEAHGTGTKVGDPQEVNAIDRVMCKERGPENPLLIGSVKSNMGHSEPASGLCAIAKVILATLERRLPGNLHYNTPNPDIPGIAEGRIKVVTENTPWNGGLVAVNSFGFGGANVHVLLKLDTASDTTTTMPLPDLPLIVPISGRTSEAIDSILNEIEPLSKSFEFYALLQQIYQENIPGNPFRGYSITSEGKQSREVIAFDGTKPPLWYVFTGMGSQWLGMAVDLKPIDAFQSSLKKSAEILRKKNFDLSKVLESSEESIFDVLPNAAVCIASIQIALVDTLRSLGLTPNGMIGHSIGELACAYTDGCLSHEETILISLARATCIMNANLPKG
ncbi:unnamed protein product, partial [Allacma fusca]